MLSTIQEARYAANVRKTISTLHFLLRNELYA